jgi:ABC-type transporter Mla subunit MlaD
MFDKQTKNKIRGLIKSSNAIKHNIALERDKLREICSELEDITQSIDEFDDDWDRAIDALSQFL